RAPRVGRRELRDEGPAYLRLFVELGGRVLEGAELFEDFQELLGLEGGEPLFEEERVDGVLLGRVRLRERVEEDDVPRVVLDVLEDRLSRARRVARHVEDVVPDL